MKKFYKSALLSLCAATFVVGCASKDVGFESSNAANTTSTSSEQAVDNKLDSVSGSEETAVESSVDNSTSNTMVESLPTDTISEGINSVQSDVSGQVVTLKSVHFAFDKYNLSDDMRQIASENAQKIDMTTQNYSNLKIKLEGNCDEWGTDEYNYALGLKRAKTAKDALIADGVSEDKIIMVSFGESNPVCKDKTVSCWKLNRRVDYRLLP